MRALNTLLANSALNTDDRHVNNVVIASTGTSVSGESLEGTSTGGSQEVGQPILTPRVILSTGHELISKIK